MKTTTLLRAAAIAAATWIAPSDSVAGDLRNIRQGEAMPTFKLAAIDGSVFDSDTAKGSVLVYVCLSAEQKRSEMAAADSQQVLLGFASEPVKLVHVTADVVQKAYFEQLRRDKSITAALVFDADRAVYGKLGLIAFPTTVIVNKEGKLDDVISLHGSDYKQLLETHIKHALGKITDKERDALLAAKPTERGSPKSASSAHRSLARLMREKGQLDEAKAELDKGLQLDPGNHETMLDLADIDIARSDYAGADAMVEKVLHDQPDHRRAQQLKGVSLFKQGKLEDSRIVLETALEMNPNPEVVHYYLGQICEQKGMKDKALEHYREALRHFLKETGAPSTGAGTPGAAPAGGSASAPAGAEPKPAK